MDSIRSTINSAPTHSVFVLQGCGHNPTGADFSHDQWKELAVLLRNHDHIPFFDVAYHGLASLDPDADVWGVRYFAEQGFEMLVGPILSISKMNNF